MVVRKIHVETFLKYLGTGITQPALVIGDDYKKYILKTQKVVEKGTTSFYDCMFINELLAYQIASHLEVPVPEAAVAYLDQRIINNDPVIQFAHRFYEGELFASLELKNKEDNLVENYVEMINQGKKYLNKTWKSFFNNITNSQDIVKIIAFDLLIANFDRYNNNGNLLVANDNGERKVFTIDHGHAFFGPIWETSKINAMRSVSDDLSGYIDPTVDLILNGNAWFGNGLGEVFHALESNINLKNLNDNPFKEVVSIIECITEELIDEWFSNIPQSWFNSVDEKVIISYYKSFILKQKNVVRHLIQRLAHRRAFTNYLGGALTWQIDKSAGTV
ncbi:hypothetical protein CEF21_14980 [Bacillus sp. FJAT-42376]|uniref:HipA family kinase n=1 Tax=Bacillus sp. FJAT-42376 TaxID=2014076 RepID=UPI000F50E7F2|nr:HipA family kinase [Bacillus sp. FJAT-42376]AZB43499.1 hypothetical protein CEF21_14980 [Bacillus sp. FJAT-42376]